MRKLLLAVAIGALVLAWVVMSNCGAPDSLQAIGLFALPAVTALCFGALGWRWPVSASTAQRLGVAIFCALFLGGIAWFSVLVVFVGTCEG